MAERSAMLDAAWRAILSLDYATAEANALTLLCGDEMRDGQHIMGLCKIHGDASDRAEAAAWVDAAFQRHDAPPAWYVNTALAYKDERDMAASLAIAERVSLAIRKIST